MLLSKESQISENLCQKAEKMFFQILETDHLSTNSCCPQISKNVPNNTLFLAVHMVLVRVKLNSFVSVSSPPPTAFSLYSPQAYILSMT